MSIPAMQNVPKKLVNTFRKIKQNGDLQDLSGEFNTRKFRLNREKQTLTYSSVFTKKRVFKFDQIEYVLPNISALMKKPIGDWVHTLYIKLKNTEKSILIATNKKEIAEVWTYVFYMEKKINLLSPPIKNGSMSGILIQMQNLPNLQIILEMSRNCEEDTYSKMRNEFKTPNNFFSFIQDQNSTEQTGLTNTHQLQLKYHEKSCDTGIKSSISQFDKTSNSEARFSFSQNHQVKSELRKSIGSMKIGSQIYKQIHIESQRHGKKISIDDFDELLNHIPEEGGIRVVNNHQDKSFLRKIHTIANDDYFNTSLPNFKNFDYKNYPLSHSNSLNTLTAR